MFEWCQFSRISHTCKLYEKLKRLKMFTWDYEITQFFLTWQIFVYHGAPDAPVNCKYGSLISSPWFSPTCVPGGVAWRTRKIWTLRFYFNGQFEIRQKFVPTKISRYTVSMYCSPLTRSSRQTAKSIVVFWLLWLVRPSCCTVLYRQHCSQQ